MKDALELWDSFLIAFTALLPLINPLGSALIFLGLVGDASADTFRCLARKIAINNIIFLVIIELLGSGILHFFGLSLHIVQFSGGIVLAAIGWSTLNQKDSDPKPMVNQGDIHVSPNSSANALMEKAFYPFTFPITSGPGTLVVTIALATRTEGSALTVNLLRHGGLLLAIVALSVIVYICYANAPRITRSIPPATANGIIRVTSFILVCIGVQIAWKGLSAMLLTLLHPSP